LLRHLCPPRFESAIRVPGPAETALMIATRHYNPVTRPGKPK
jgi:hypothetical protein